MLARVIGLLVATAMLFGYLAFTAPAAAADEEDGAMAVDCDGSSAGVQSNCDYATGASFSVQVHVAQAPEDGYAAFQAKLRWPGDALEYLPAARAAEEALWSRCDVAARSVRQPADPPGPDSLLFACVPMPALAEPEAVTGPALQFAFRCESEGSAAIILVEKKGDAQHGTHFLDLDNDKIKPKLVGASVTCTGPTPAPPGGTPESAVEAAVSPPVSAASRPAGPESRSISQAVVPAPGGQPNAPVALPATGGGSPAGRTNGMLPLAAGLACAGCALLLGAAVATLRRRI